MIKSMTGYGKSSTSNNGVSLTIEVKSLNSKFFDANVKMPQAYRLKELELRNLLSAKLTRGKIELAIAVERSDETGAHIINKEIVKAYFNQLSAINDELNANDGNLLQAALRLPNAVLPSRETLNEDEWNAVHSGVSKAIEQLDAFRIEEGKSLKNDLSLRVTTIQKLTEEVKKLEPKRAENIKTRIEEHLKYLSKQDNIDTNRLEQEMIYYMEKLDVNEEFVRLDNHCNYFIEVLNNEGDSNGKKLNFISQEMGREINTLGSKANDGDIQKLVVQMKDQLEKIKEQSMNIL